MNRTLVLNILPDFANILLYCDLDLSPRTTILNDRTIILVSSMFLFLKLITFFNWIIFFLFRKNKPLGCPFFFFTFNYGNFTGSMSVLFNWLSTLIIYNVHQIFTIRYFTVTLWYTCLYKYSHFYICHYNNKFNFSCQTHAWCSLRHFLSCIIQITPSWLILCFTEVFLKH